MYVGANQRGEELEISGEGVFAVLPSSPHLLLWKCSYTDTAGHCTAAHVPTHPCCCPSAILLLYSFCDSILVHLKQRIDYVTPGRVRVGSQPRMEHLCHLPVIIFSNKIPAYSSQRFRLHPQFQTKQMPLRVHISARANQVSLGEFPINCCDEKYRNMMLKYYIYYRTHPCFLRKFIPTKLGRLMAP